MESRRDDGPQERERLSGFLERRQVEKKGPKTPARRSLSYVGAVAWFAVGVLTLTLVGAGQRPRRSPIAATLRPPSAEIIRPLTPGEPALLPAERAAMAGATSVSASGDYAGPECSASGRGVLSAPASVYRRGTVAPPVAASRLTATVAKARRWVGYMPEVKAGQAIVRWVKSQPPPDGRRLAKPDRPQTL
jgi:hypothetical protein